MNWFYNLFRSISDWFFGKFGYFRPEVNSNIVEQLYEAFQTEQDMVSGLNYAYGTLHRRAIEDNAIITSMILMQGQEVITLQAAYMQDIMDKKLGTMYTVNNDGSLTLTVQISGTTEEEHTCNEETCGN